LADFKKKEYTEKLSDHYKEINATATNAVKIEMIENTMLSFALASGPGKEKRPQKSSFKIRTGSNQPFDWTQSLDGHGNL